MVLDVAQPVGESDVAAHSGKGITASLNDFEPLSMVVVPVTVSVMHRDPDFTCNARVTPVPERHSTLRVRDERSVTEFTGHVGQGEPGEFAQHLEFGFGSSLQVSPSFLVGFLLAFAGFTVRDSRGLLGRVTAPTKLRDVSGDGFLTASWFKWHVSSL